MFAIIRRQVALKVALFSTLGALCISTLIWGGFYLFDVMELSNQQFFVVAAFFLFLCLLLQGGLVLLFVSIFVNRPLARLSEVMLRVEEGQTKIDLPKMADDELGELGVRTGAMVESLREMSVHRERMQHQLSQVEEKLNFKTALEEKAKIIERMNSELASAFSDLSLLYTVSQSLSSVLEIKELCMVVSRFFSEHFPCERFALFYVVADGACLRLDCQKGFTSIAGEEILVPVGQGLVGMTAQKKRSHFLERWSSVRDLRPFEFESQLQGSALSLPLKIRDELIGVLLVEQPSQRHFRPTDRQALESVASQIAIAFDRCRLYMKTRDLSVRDELTGIYNRRYFQQMLRLEIKRATRFGHSVSLLMVDVDHFKQFNDAHGHLMGDLVLRQLTSLISSHIREVDVLARYGGEEFVILLVDTSLKEAVQVAEKLRELVRSHLTIESHEIPPVALGEITISVGVSAFPECCDRQADLIRTADEALYRAKEAGRDQVVCYAGDVKQPPILGEKNRFVH